MKLHSFSKLLFGAVAVSALLAAPISAQDDPSFTDDTGVNQEDDSQAEPEEETPEQARERKKAAREARRAKEAESMRNRLPFKWFSTPRTALAYAKKHRLGVIVVYYDPSASSYGGGYGASAGGESTNIEKTLFKNKKLTRQRGIGLGVRSKKPMPDYNLNESGSACIVLPDGSTGQQLRITPSTTPETIIEALQAARQQINDGCGMASDAGDDQE